MSGEKACVTMMASEVPRRRSSSHTITIQSTQLLDSVKKALFIVGTTLLLFSAFRNSVTWQLQKFWGSSGHFWQSCWDNVYNIFGQSDFTIGVFGTTLVTMCVFWLANLFLILLDVTGKPEFLLRYKIQSDKNCPLDKGKLWSAVKLVLFNQTVIGIPFTAVGYCAMKWRGCIVTGELPTFQWVLLELIVFVLVEELGFYYTHRLLHHPKIYRFIHKRHHEWTAPIGITGLYSHPVEHLFSNLLPPMLGPFLMGSHMATTWMWFCMALLSTTVAHCGYHFPLLPSPEAHDFHHLKFNQNFGVLGVLDRLHGTDNQFRASKVYQRHILLLGLVPLTQQFPDNPSKTIGKDIQI